MNGDCNVNQPTKFHDNDDDDDEHANNEKATEGSPQPVSTTTNGRRKTGKRKKRKAPPVNNLSVKFSASSDRQIKQHSERTQLDTKDSLESIKSQRNVVASATAAAAVAIAVAGTTTDLDTSSLFTTTSEITTDDDAASIEIRLKQLVVEQEEKLELDDRYRSTPVLTHRVITHSSNNNNKGFSIADDNAAEGGGRKSNHQLDRFERSNLPLNTRAKSANDLAINAAAAAVATTASKKETIFDFEPPANIVSAGKQVPDVVVIQVEEEQQQQRKIDRNYRARDSIHTAAKGAQEIIDRNAHRARALSVASPPTTDRRASIENAITDADSSTSGFMRRNVSSSLLLPERGNLRTLNSNRAGSGAIGNDELATGRDRSNTAGSIDRSALFGHHDEKQLNNIDQSMLSIQRSAWTLSDFDQTFNKSANNASAASGLNATDNSPIMSIDQQQKFQQFSSISDTPRGSNGSDWQSGNLLKMASKNAINQTQQFRQQQQPDNNSLQIRALIGNERQGSFPGVSNLMDRRQSFSHSIVSLPSSIDSYTQNKLAPSYKRKQHRLPSFSAGGTHGNDENEKRSCWKSCCNLTVVSQYLPILEWLPNYNLNTFYHDVGAGLAVSFLNISTCIAAAIVAETDFGAAFKASIVNNFVYAILASSKHVAFGSWSIMSQMLLLGVRRALNDELILDRLKMGSSASWSAEEYEKWHMNIIIMYTFLIGLVQLVCGVLNLGNILSSFIPEALSSSMIAGTAFTMAINQIANMCGTSNKILWQIERNTTELWADLKNPPVDITDLFANTFRWVQQIILLLKHRNQINLVCVIISIISVILLLLNQYVIQQYLQKLFKRKILISSEMVLLIVMIITSYFMNLHDNYYVPTCGPVIIEFGLPNIPNLKLIRELWFDSLATALISYTIVCIMAKTYSNKLNYEVNYNQELIACGAGNLIGGLFDALPATASLSRTAGQVEAGGKTQMASIINCILLVVLGRLLGQFVAVLPTCVMSAAIFYGFCRMMTRFTEVFIYWRICKVDFAIWIVTFVSILAVDLVNGFIFGFIFSILTMLYRAQTRRCYMLGTIGSSDVYVPLVKYPVAQEIEGIRIFQFCGPIHYVCADLVERLLRQKTRVNVKEILRYISDQGIDKFDPLDLDLPTHIILDFSMISYIDSAGLHTIKKIIEDYQKINVTILLASLASHVAAVVKTDPSLWNVYKERFYITLADAVHCAVRDKLRQMCTGGGGERYPRFDDSNSTSKHV